MSNVRTSRSEAWTGRLILVVMVAFTLLPFVSMLSAALQEAGSNPTGLSVPSPAHPENFATAFTMARVPTLMGSSALLVLMVVPAALALATAAAYGISVLRVPGGRLVFLVFLMGLTIPFEGLITPLYYLMRDAGLLNTRPAIALPLIALYMPFGVFWMRAHFSGVPKELNEAASIDGAGPWRALRHVHLPLAKPALSTLAVLYSLWTWNQFLVALVMMDDPLRRTVAGALGAFQGQYGTDIVLLSAGALLIMLPTIVVFAVFQKQFVAALLQGSVKG
ncbi:carbohydrate ABC transporter permease [Cellulomonas bogoriensis]|uniref:Sugar ABC transporter permease n=1 Tax=Cellulomonas bogoriensis 69B4 = DSM 16987 TaxID=1386082 RepID=A0A0A0C0I6_9CELL|nr:carbohydrate ABC transporter permease [Cellulomonas bogoriensis]KGM13686.1 sugar ABC transporter permease [Cellulomonas bogoriensis 69B4 = DSM 16987]